jgi:hypothetical protein
VAVLYDLHRVASFLCSYVLLFPGAHSAMSSFVPLLTLMCFLGCYKYHIIYYPCFGLGFYIYLILLPDFLLVVSVCTAMRWALKMKKREEERRLREAAFFLWMPLHILCLVGKSTLFLRK